MRILKFLGFAALIGLAGCFEDGSSVASQPAETGFKPWSRSTFFDKVVLRSAVAKTGPMFLGPLGLIQRSDTTNFSWSTLGATGYGTDFYGQLMLPFQQSFRRYVRPWIDSTYWIDALPGAPEITISRVHPDGIGMATINLDQCPDLPQAVFSAARDSGENPIANGSILRSGSFAFAFVHEGWSPAPEGGVVVLRIRPYNSGFPGCGTFSDTLLPISARWAKLTPSFPWVNSFNGIRVLDAIPATGGVLVSYESRKLNDSSDFRLAFVDTMGILSTLDSSKTGFYSRLFHHGGKVWGIHYARGVVELSLNGSWSQRKTSWTANAWPECYGVAGRCVLYAQDKLFALDSNSLDVTELDRSGVEDNRITGVVQYKDTVYVSTLSGVFTKPVARFFDPAK